MHDEVHPVAGTTRRALLARLLDEMESHHRRRRRRRYAAAAGGLAVLALTAALVVAPRAVRTEAPPLAAVPPAKSIVVTIVQTDPMVVARYRAGGGDSGSRVDVISDGELLRSLAAIGRPTGMIRIEGRATLTRSVVDPDPVPDDRAPRGL